jgi:lysozyme family protein
MTSAFDRALGFTLAQEGGYVNNPLDPGGETRFGISKRQFPDLDIKELTREAAAVIYREKYWDAIAGDELPPLTALVLFDFAVHSGVSTAVSALQKQMGGLEADGKVGPLTIARAQQHADPAFDRVQALVLCDRRLRFLTKLVKRQPTKRLPFLTGWTRRLLWLGVAVMEGYLEISRPGAPAP